MSIKEKAWISGFVIGLLVMYFMCGNKKDV